jgi:hypothetical protein
LKKELNNLKMKEGTTTEGFLWSLDAIVMQLCDLDEVLTEKALIHIVLDALPASWSSFKSTFGTLVASPAINLTFSHFKGQLQAEEFCQLTSNTSQHKKPTLAAATVAAQNLQIAQLTSQLNQRPYVQAKKKKWKNGNLVPTCAHCAKRGHVD